MNNKNGSLKKGERENIIELVKQFPERYKVGTYRGEKPKKGSIVSIGNMNGTVIAVDLPENEHCTVDTDLAEVMINCISDKVKIQLNIIDDLVELFGPLRIYPFKEVINNNGNSNVEKSINNNDDKNEEEISIKKSMVWEFDNASFLNMAETSNKCMNNLIKLMVNAKKLTSLSKRKAFKNLIDQFQ